MLHSAQTPIPVLDLSPEVEAHFEAFMATLAEVLRSGEYIMGRQVRAFEAECAAFLGTKHAIGVNSGTDALVIALKALGVGPGDEVITTPFTFFATAEAITITGATPVFVDIDPVTFNLDPVLIESQITPQTKVLLPVHLYGQAADMHAIRDLACRYGLKVLEDTAQAFGGTFAGAQLGTLGDLGAYSFFPTKNLGGFGDGGLITTDDDRLAEQARMLRVHGAKRKYHNEIVGFNSRLDELQAALLRIKLPHLTDRNEGRRAAAAVYRGLLDGVEGLVLPVEAPGRGHVYHQYTVRITGGRRDEVQQRLAASGVSTMVYYPVPVHRLPVYVGRYDPLPVSEQCAREVLALPIWPWMPDRTQQQVASALRVALKGLSVG